MVRKWENSHVGNVVVTGVERRGSLARVERDGSRTIWARAARTRVVRIVVAESPRGVVGTSKSY